MTEHWQPPQYDPRQHQRHPAPGPWEQPPAWPHEPPRRRRSRAPLLAGLAAAAVVAAGGTAYALSGHHGAAAARLSAAKPLTCRQQYQAWRTGPVHAPGERLKADGAAVDSAGGSQDIPATVTALRALGTDAATVSRYPVPACADPAGYWQRELSAMKAAGDNAGTSSGLGAILLAEAPLKGLPALDRELTAEIKRTTGY